MTATANTHVSNAPISNMVQSVIAYDPSQQSYQLRYLIDVDGFQVDGRFLAKELAICDLRTRRISLYRFQVGKFNKLNEANRKQVVWLRNNIHGLDFVDGPLDSPAEQLDQLIVALCATAQANNEMIGYKGGRYELDMLVRCGYAHLGINIELLGCPRLEVLIGQNQQFTSVMCANHRPLRKKNGLDLKLPHCPQMEVMYFMNYLLDVTLANKQSIFYQTNDIYTNIVPQQQQPMAVPSASSIPQPATITVQEPQSALTTMLIHEEQQQQPQQQHQIVIPPKKPLRKFMKKNQQQKQQQLPPNYVYSHHHQAYVESTSL